MIASVLPNQLGLTCPGPAPLAYGPWGPEDLLEDDEEPEDAEMMALKPKAAKGPAVVVCA